MNKESVQMERREPTPREPLRFEHRPFLSSPDLTSAVTDRGELTIYEIVSAMVSGLVDHAEDVEIDKLKSEGITTLRIRVNPLDVGKLIGKQGRTARSMRTIVSAAAMKTGKRFNIDIVQLDNQPTPRIDSGNTETSNLGS